MLPSVARSSTGFLAQPGRGKGGGSLTRTDDAARPRVLLIPTHTKSCTHHEGRAEAAHAGGEEVHDSAQPLLLVVVVDERLANHPLELHLRPELSLPGTTDKGDWRAPANRTTERGGVRFATSQLVKPTLLDSDEVPPGAPSRTGGTPCRTSGALSVPPTRSPVGTPRRCPP